MTSTLRATARLTLLLFLVGLVASRAGVVVHELGGHYGVARSFGCTLTRLRLFLFGGGYVDYACGPLTAAQQLATDLGGIAVQVGAGALLAFVAWRHAASRLTGLVLASMAVLFVVHGLFYLVTGIHYGVGDGRALHVLLGGERGGLVAIGSAVLVALCFLAATRLARRLAPWLPSHAGGARRVAIACAAMLAAAALHGAAFELEQRVIADAAYAATFRPEPAIAVERELRRYEVEERPAPEQVAERRRVLEQRHALFPLRPVLGAGMALAAVAGLFVALRRVDPPEPADATGTIARAAVLFAIAEAIVVALDRLL